MEQTNQYESLNYLWDQLRHLPLTPQSRYVSLSELSGMETILSPAHFSRLHQHVLRASYFESLSKNDSEDMCHLFTKALPIPNQARKFPVLLWRSVSKSPGLQKTVVQLLLLSLLGNYPHITKRPLGEARNKLYDLFNQNNDMFKILCIFCCPLLVNAMREFIAFSLDHHPWLKKHLEPLIQLKKFRRISTEAMDHAREYFNLYLCHPKSALYHFNTNEEAKKTVLFELNQFFLSAHAQILKISYRRPNINSCGFIASTRKNYPMVPIPTKEELASAEMAEQTEEQFALWIEQQLQLEDPIEDDPQPDDQEELPLKESKYDEDDDVAAAIQYVVRLGMKKKPVLEYNDLPIWKYVRQDVYKALQAVVQRESPLELGCLNRCIKWLDLFAVKQEVIHYVLEILDGYENKGLSIEKLKQRFVKLQKYEPYSYTLVQLIASLIKQAERHIRFLELPLHYKQYQLEALKSKFDLTMQNNAVLEQNLSFVFCPVCNTDYSIIIVFPNKTTGKRMYTQYYRCGLRDALVDYDTNEIFCRNNKCNILGRCKDQPLTRAPLLGRMMFRNNKCYMICPQEGCGLKMEYDPARCWFNHRGAACADCTQKHLEKPVQYERLVQKYTVMGIKRCFKCFAELPATGDNYHLLPADGVYLCKKDATEFILRTVRDRYTTDKQKKPTTQELQKFLLDTWEASKAKFKDKNEQRNKQNLKNYKKQQGNKRVRR